MCGIVGYIGSEAAAPFLLEGLKKLEYRGYDSAGIAVVDETGITTYRAKGDLRYLTRVVADHMPITPCIGIGHTRWATHGKPSRRNAHPHRSETGLFSVVHNGIIENYRSLKRELEEKGVTFRSETDSEVVAQLLEQVYSGDPLTAIRTVTAQLQGSYALGILCADTPHTLFAVRCDSPLIIGLSDTAYYLASDIPALLSHTRRMISPQNHEIAVLTRERVTVYDSCGNVTEPTVTTVTWDANAAEKGGFAHFMLKEIMEQPKALTDTISPRLDGDGGVVLDELTLTAAQWRRFNRVVIIACGSAYHAGVVAKYAMEQLIHMTVETELASEFRYRDPLVDEQTLVIVISQSGETADTLSGLKEAKRRGAHVLSIVNVVGSSIANESDDVLYTHAGPEIAVATTKAYTAQLAVLYLLGIYMARIRGCLTAVEERALTHELSLLPQITETLLTQAPAIQKLAQRYATSEHAYFIGRHLDYAVALEAALKLKEISYIHAEAYAAGELKHGTISLIEEGTPVVAVMCCKALAYKTASNIKEVKARGARVLLVTTEEQRALTEDADDTLYIPRVNDLFLPLAAIVPLQLFSYYTALARDCEIDKPRNLAKSVTVE